MTDAWAGVAAAAAEIALPFVVGRALQPRLQGVGVRLALLVGPTIVLALADLAWPTLDAWDVVLVGGMFGIGLATSDASRVAVARQVTALGLFALVGEAAARQLLPPVPNLIADTDLTLLLDTHTSDAAYACGLMYPDAYPGGAFAQAVEGVDPNEPVVVHLGDSMLRYTDQRRDGPDGGVDVFPSLLDDADVRRRHVNLGAPGTTFETYLLAERAAVSRLHVDHVVVHVLFANDLYEVGRPFPCCDQRLLLDLDRPGVPASCPTPPSAGRWRRLADRSRAPLALRILSSHSTLAAHLRVRLIQVIGRVPWVEFPKMDNATRDDADVQVAWRVAEAVFHAMHAELGGKGIGLTVVALPVASEVPTTVGGPWGPVAARVARLQAFCAREGIDFVDARGAMPEVPFDPSLFMQGAHFSEKGHHRIAEFLAPRLGVPSTAR